MKNANDNIAVHIIITGLDLFELQKYTGEMSDVFGLDEKIFNYKGSRPITLYRWDLDCILAVIESALTDKAIYPDPEGFEYNTLRLLQRRLDNEYSAVFGNQRYL